jgi:hypothetical protein
MGEQAGYQVSRSGYPDPIPLLPRGAALFEGIPLRAVVAENLAPAMGDGILLVRDRDRGAVVLVRDGALVETHAFTGVGGSHTGDGVLDEVRSWPDAQVSAYRLDPPVVDVCEALLRGEILYSDLRLEWVDWPALLADLARRGGAYVIEISTPVGQGVTCIAGGRQALSYTDIHPELGDPALLEAMASNKDGSIRVRRLNAAGFAAAAQLVGHAGATTSAQPQPVAAGDHPGNGAARTAPQGGAPDREPAAPAATVTPEATEPQPVSHSAAEEVLPDLTWVAPWQAPWREETGEPAGQAGAGDGERSEPSQPSVAEVLEDLRAIARRRLQMSASRVEAILDDAAREQRPLDAVLKEIRTMSIRGVMPSTVDAMVAEMLIVAAERRSV